MRCNRYISERESIVTAYICIYIYLWRYCVYVSTTPDDDRLPYSFLSYISIFFSFYLKCHILGKKQHFISGECIYFYILYIFLFSYILTSSSSSFLKILYFFSLPILLFGFAFALVVSFFCIPVGGDPARIRCRVGSF